MTTTNNRVGTASGQDAACPHSSIESRASQYETDKFNIRDHVGKLTPAKDKNKYICPVCNGNNLSVNPGNGAYKCFNGCINEDVREAIAPWAEKLAILKPSRPKQSRQWIYTDINGNPVVKTRRNDDGNGGRKIWQEYFVGGKWVTKGNDALKKSVTPYRYTDIKKAIDAGETVLWVEGEPCADALWALGIPATTSIGGSASYKNYGDYKSLMQGAKLVLCPDQDQIGIKYIEQVASDFSDAQFLYAFPESPRWNSLPKDKGLDIADWIESGATKEQIFAAIESKRSLKTTSNVVSVDFNGKSKPSIDVHDALKKLSEQSLNGSKLMADLLELASTSQRPYNAIKELYEAIIAEQNKDAISDEEWQADLQELNSQKRSEAERYEALFDDRPLSHWIGDAAQYYNTGYDPSNNVFVAAAWTHLCFVNALMPANLRTMKLPNVYRDGEEITVNSIVFLAADRNGGKTTARNIVAKTFGEFVLNQIQAEWIREALRAKKQARDEAKSSGEERESSPYDYGSPRVEFGDVTIAALSKAIGVNDWHRRQYNCPSFGGILTLDEGADFLQVNSMLDIKNKNPGFSFINGVWSGFVAGRNRMGSSESGNSINGVGLSMLIPLQSDKYQDLCSHPNFGSSGLNSRVICVPLKKIASNLEEQTSLSTQEVLLKLKQQKTRTHYPNQAIIRAIGNVRRTLIAQQSLIEWSEEAIEQYLLSECLFINRTLDPSSEEATMRQRSFEDNLSKCAAMLAVSDAIFKLPEDACDVGIIQIERTHVERAVDLCFLSLEAQLYFWDKTAADREKASNQSIGTARRVDWIELFKDPMQLSEWVKSKKKAGLDSIRKVSKTINGNNRKALKQAGIDVAEAIAAVW